MPRKAKPQPKENATAPEGESFAKDLEAAGLPPDPAPEVAPGLMDAHGEAVRALRAWFDSTAKDLELGEALADGPAVSIMWGGSRIDLVEAGQGGAPLPELVDANGKIRVRRGGARKDTILRVDELRAWILNDDVREAKASAQQVDLEGKPVAKPKGHFVENNRSHLFLSEHYKLKITEGNLDKLRGMDTDGQRLLAIDSAMRLKKEVTKQLTEPLPEDVRALERGELLALITADEDDEEEAGDE